MTQQDVYRNPLGGRHGSGLAFRGVTGWVGLCSTIVGFTGATFVFLQVQVLEAYPFYHGVFGTEFLFPGVTYTVSLEVFSLVAFIGVLSWSYSRAKGEKRARLGKAVGETLLIFGILVAVIVYVETRLLWGEIAPGIHVWQGLPGGGGYPWGTEQVAYNTCFIESAVRGDCTFLNYNELFWMAISSSVVGFILRYSFSDGSD